MFVGSDVGLTGLAARRTNPSIGFSFMGGALPIGATLTRATPGFRHDASGALENAGTDSARFDHDPVTLALRGLLVEPARTNASRGSQGFAGSAWTRRGTLSTTDNAVSAPDGTMTGSLWAGLGATGANDIFEAGFGISARFPASAPCMPSFWLRPVSTAGNMVLQTAFGPASGSMTVNLALLTAGVWTRIDGTHPAVTPGNAFVSTASGQSGLLFACSAGAPISVHLWGVQLEAGTTASSYVPTTAASATRAADTLVLDWGSKGIADGNHMMRYSFDNGTSQDVATAVAGGVATVPTTLNRAWIKSVDRL